MVSLSEDEKDHIAKQLAYSGTVGGWFLLIMGGVTVGMTILILIRFAGNGASDDGGAVGLGTLAMAFFVAGGWLIGRRRAIRRSLDDSLLPGRGEVVTVDPPSESGWMIHLLLQTPSHMEVAGTMQGYGKPPWAVGETIDLIFLLNETRFFPREFDFKASLGVVHTADRVERGKRLKFVIYSVLALLLGIGMVVGILDSLGG